MSEHKSQKRWVRWAVPTLVGFIALGVGFNAGQDETPASVTTDTGNQAIRPDETPEPITKTVTEEVTPQECLDALDDAEDIAHISGRFAHVASAYPTMVSDAAVAGSTYDTDAMNDIADRMDESTTKILGLNDQLESEVSSYNVNASACRAADNGAV
jgi:hypothetical protein